MNKKGFTLVELLASITIISLIATIASINIGNILSKEEEIANNNKDNIITTAACLYIELSNNKDLKNTCLNEGCSITTTTLIKAGILKEEDVDNPEVINITKQNHTKICTIKE